MTTFSSSYRACVDEHSGKESTHKAADPYDSSPRHSTYIPLFFTCEGIFVDKNNGTLSALATVAIAAFTLTLWRATTKLWSSGERQHAISNRAFVFVDGFNFEITTAADGKSSDIDSIPEKYRADPGLFITRFAVQPKWKNSGNTPTRKMVMQVNWKYIVGNSEPEFNYVVPARSLFLGPQSVEVSDFIEIPPAQGLVDYEMHYSGERPMIYVWGRAAYEDVFGGAHFVEWCRKLRFERHVGEKVRATLIQWGDYNRSDENDGARH